MTGLDEAARRIAAARAETLADELAHAAEEQLGGAAVRRTGQGVVLRGRSLARRLAFLAPVALLVAALKARR